MVHGSPCCGNQQLNWQTFNKKSEKMSEIFQQSLNQQNYGSVNTVNKQELTIKLDLI